jgi:EAL domain-containing protein (putative c-di-GMP-specific phosphodiesterase class I)
LFIVGDLQRKQRLNILCSPAQSTSAIHRGVTMMMQSGQNHLTAGGSTRFDNRKVPAIESNSVNTAAEEFILKCAQDESNSAIEIGEMRLRYQPQIDMADGKITGVEAQVNWAHPEFGAVSHSALAALIGGTAMEKTVSEWAVRQACTNLRTMSQHGLPAVHTTIRLSARQLMSPHLAGCVRESLMETGISPERIEFGVAESTLLWNYKAMAPALKNLADTGVGIAIRDFGSDRSGLSYPKRFPVSAIWIDCPFFWHFASGSDAAEIVRSIRSLAENLNIKLVAWGVESASQMMLLYNEGCRVMQGSYLCQPLQIDPFADLVKQVGTTAYSVSQGRLNS